MYELTYVRIRVPLCACIHAYTHTYIQQEALGSLVSLTKHSLELIKNPALKSFRRLIHVNVCLSVLACLSLSVLV